jgi:Spy/CpxP family protein refolding chaperone
MKTPLCVIVLMMAVSCGVKAQDRPPRDPMGAYFFPPELLMENQGTLNLTEDQKKEIKGEIQKAQSQFTDLQWQLKKEAEAMGTLLKPDRVDEKQAIAQLDKVLGLEREVKRAQVTLMVRIKNALSPEQQLTLRKLKQERDERISPKQQKENEER